jgi:hypothetical protein
MVASCRMAGQSPQEAFDTVGALLEERYKEWETAITDLPSWGPEIDAQVARYVEGIQNVVQANVTWSFQSGRYFGKQAQEIRRTRLVDVMTNPPYLQQQQQQQRQRHATNMQHSGRWSKSLSSLVQHVSWSFLLSLVIICYFAVVIRH